MSNFVGAIVRMSDVTQPKGSGAPYIRMQIQSPDSCVYVCFADADVVGGLAIGTRVVVAPTEPTRSGKPRVKFVCIDGLAAPAPDSPPPPPTSNAHPLLALPPGVDRELKAIATLYLQTYDIVSARNGGRLDDIGVRCATATVVSNWFEHGDRTPADLVAAFHSSVAQSQSPPIAS